MDDLAAFDRVWNRIVYGTVPEPLRLCRRCHSRGFGGGVTSYARVSHRRYLPGCKAQDNYCYYDCCDDGPHPTYASARRRTRNIKAVVKRRVATVLRDNLHLALRVRDEPKRNHRIRAQ